MYSDLFNTYLCYTYMFICLKPRFEPWLMGGKDHNLIELVAGFYVTAVV